MDTVAPSTPPGFALGLVSGNPRLSWSVSTDNYGVAGYAIYRSTNGSFTDLAGLAADSIIDNVLGSGAKSGYGFAAGPGAGTLADLAFTATGTPTVSTGATQTGARFFFTDETQVVRFVVGAAATSGSGAIGN